MVLTNAIYFKAKWQNAFEKKDTAKELFYETPVQNNTVPMMHQICKYCGYSENDRYQALALPYKGGDIEMVVLLPRDNNGLEALEQSLNPQGLREALESLTPYPKVEISLPVFRIESEFKLREQLSALGMHAAFDATEADFSGITGKKDVFIGDVLHKAYVEVDEEGTEAAAATAVVMRLATAVMEEQTKTFTANHPFLFVVRDTKTGIIYFMGRVARL